MSYQKYYVPDQSKYPIFMAFALFLLVMGASSTINSLDDPESNAVYVLYSGLAVMAITMFLWFRTVTKEQRNFSHKIKHQRKPQKTKPQKK